MMYNYFEYDFFYNYKFKKLKLLFISMHGDWGLGIGDWGLGIGDWGLGPIPNHQTPIHHTPSPIPNDSFLFKISSFKIKSFKKHF